ncbi:MAG: ribonuclease R [Peptoniphilaceae bacterium]|nr:ribonuclease R [Peptoniphilaceae bacterium]MDY6018415.1 ribonuclease R [Anaerococcus sp.]
MNTKDLILNIINDKDYKPTNLDGLGKFLRVDKYTKKALADLISDLNKDGQIKITTKGKILPLTEKEKSLVGKIVMAQGGYGFFVSDNEEFEDVFIGGKYLNTAHNNDKVRIEIIKENEEGKKSEGRVVEVLERKNTGFVGTYQKNKGFGFVVADDKTIEDVYIDKKFSKGAKNKDKVLVEIIAYPKGNSPEGRIVEILGNIHDKNIDIISSIRSHGIPNLFSKKTKKELLYIKDQVDENEKVGRKDYRDLFTVTIDGRDSKDFDDAISIEKQDDAYILYVHIADVAHYVKKHTAIDDDAYARGNSTYLYNIVVPMLPEELSNGICSLKPKLDRLTLTVRMTIDKKGKVIDNEFSESIINSDYRLVYDDVNSYIDDKNEDVFEDESLKSRLKDFEALYKILKEKRSHRGSIDFDFTESQIDVTADGQVLNISRLDRGSGNKMIEEFMLVANETVASLFAYIDFPFIYRIHEKPKKEKIDSFKRILNTLGYNIRGSELYPKDFQEILKKVKGKDEESLVNVLMLRTMQKAKYSEERKSHFGLSTDYYTHFTSPIRRYPDLIVHRLLKKFIKNKLYKINRTSLEEELARNAEHLSITERRSEECERDVEDLLKCKYMEKYLGAYFSGIISSITEFGIFVELKNTVEGLFMYKFSPDRYEYIEEELVAYKVKTKKRYKIGQEVKIRVRNIDVEKRNIDFDLVDDINENIS